MRIAGIVAALTLLSATARANPPLPGLEPPPPPVTEATPPPPEAPLGAVIASIGGTVVGSAGVALGVSALDAAREGDEGTRTRAKVADVLLWTGIVSVTAAVVWWIVDEAGE